MVGTGIRTLISWAFQTGDQVGRPDTARQFVSEPNEGFDYSKSVPSRIVVGLGPEETVSDMKTQLLAKLSSLGALVALAGAGCSSMDQANNGANVTVTALSFSP